MDDIDNGGKLDIWTDGRGAGRDAHQMVWYRNPEYTKYPIAVGDYKYGDLGDVDGNGDLDVVNGCDHGKWLVWGKCPADPTSPWPEHLISADFRLMSMDVGDLEGDGDIDIVAGVHKGRGRVFVFENERSGKVWKMHDVGAGDYPGLDHYYGIQLSGIDNDGNQDIVPIG